MTTLKDIAELVADPEYLPGFYGQKQQSILKHLVHELVDLQARVATLEQQPPEPPSDTSTP